MEKKQELINSLNYYKEKIEKVRYEAELMGINLEDEY
jgi:hypothetical protein